MKKKQEIIYSDTVNEIISKPPKSIVRWGNMIVFAVFSLLILLSWFFVYPEKTEASAVIVRNDITASDSLPGEYMGILTMNIANFSKVTSGQQVNIRLTAYPYKEYGIIRGSVISKTIAESGNSVELTVRLPDGLVTNYDRKLEYFRNMQGDADIITGKQRLLQIIIDPLIRLFAKKG